MATNYFPLIANATANTINELPAGDNLDLTGSNVVFTTANTGIEGGTYAALFEGNEYLNVGGSNVITAGGNVTVECWIKPPTTSVIAIFDGGPGEAYILRQFQGNEVGLGGDNGLVGFTVTANVWQHFATTMDSSGVINVYIDGVLQGTATAGFTLVSGATFNIGAVNGGEGLYTGLISNFRVTNKIVYTTEFIPPTKALTATQSANTNGVPSAAITGTDVSLLTFQNSTLVDNSTFARTLTSVGDSAPVTVSYTTELFGASFLYDGTQWQSTSLSITGNLSVSGTIPTANVTSANIGSLTSYGVIDLAGPTPGLLAGGNTLTGGIWAGGFYQTEYVSPTYIATDGVSYDLGTGNPDFTIEGWFNCFDLNPSSSTAAVGINTIFSGGGWPGHANPVWTLQIDATTNKLVAFLNGVGYLESTAPIQINTWYHAAIVRTGGVATLFVNGIAEDTLATSSGTPAGGFPFLISSGGTSEYGGGGTFYGTITNVRFVQGIAVYTSNFTLPTALLASTQTANTNGNPSAAITGTETQLLTLQNNTIIDNSSYNTTLLDYGVVIEFVTSPFGGSATMSKKSGFIYDGNAWVSDSGLIVNDITSGIVNFVNTANVSLGNVSNLHISGGSSGYVLTTDGANNLSWTAGGGGGSGATGATGYD